MRSSQVLIRSSPLVRASNIQIKSRNRPGFDPSILLHSGILEVADKTVLNKVLKYQTLGSKLTEIGEGFMRIRGICLVNHSCKLYFVI